MKFSRVSSLAALVLTATACSYGSASGGGALNACSLISAQRAGTILGASVTSKPVGPKPTSASDGSECVYSTGSVGGGFMLIAARPGFSDAKAEAQSQMETARKDQPPPGVPGIKVKTTNGPGEAAWLGTSSVSTQLHVLDHGVSLVVAINHPDSPKVRAQARKLAQAALNSVRK